MILAAPELLENPKLARQLEPLVSSATGNRDHSRDKLSPIGQTTPALCDNADIADFGSTFRRNHHSAEHGVCRAGSCQAGYCRAGSDWDLFSLPVSRSATHAWECHQARILTHVASLCELTAAYQVSA